MEQLAFEGCPDYEVETLFGATGPAFPVIITPMTNGAVVQAPPDVEYRAQRCADGALVVWLRILR